MSQLLQQLSINTETAKKGCPVAGGGPVEGARGFILHSNDFELAEPVKIDGGLGVTGTVEALKAV